VAAALVGGRLLSLAVRADTAAADALDARETEARMAERVRQYDMLHTNVLTTLTLIARGSGVLSPELRARCDRDAKYLSAVVHSVVDASPAGLNARLAEVVFDQGALDMDIHYDPDGLPLELPEDVVAALALAVKEALNNVLKYAGTAEAWVVATGEDVGSIRITVTDRGQGFVYADIEPGLGLSRVLGTALSEIGGRARVTSRPGTGTRVEIEWKK
jgi:signal transduction histidine kinase